MWDGDHDCPCECELEPLHKQFDILRTEHIDKKWYNDFSIMFKRGRPVTITFEDKKTAYRYLHVIQRKYSEYLSILAENAPKAVFVEEPTKWQLLRFRLKELMRWKR